MAYLAFWKEDVCLEIRARTHSRAQVLEAGAMWLRSLRSVPVGVRRSSVLLCHGGWTISWSLPFFAHRGILWAYYSNVVVKRVRLDAPMIWRSLIVDVAKIAFNILVIMTFLSAARDWEHPRARVSSGMWDPGPSSVGSPDHSRPTRHLSECWRVILRRCSLLLCGEPVVLHRLVAK